MLILYFRFSLQRRRGALVNQREVNDIFLRPDKSVETLEVLQVESQTFSTCKVFQRVGLTPTKPSRFALYPFYLFISICRLEALTTPQLGYQWVFCFPFDPQATVPLLPLRSHPTSLYVYLCSLIRNATVPRVDPFEPYCASLC